MAKTTKATKKTLWQDCKICS